MKWPNALQAKSSVTSGQASAALSEMSKAQAQKVANLVVEAKTRDPNKAWDKIVKESRLAGVRSPPLTEGFP